MSDSEKSEEYSFLWYGCATVELSVADTRLVIDPYFEPEVPKFDYVFCTQEHFDHYYPETLKKLCVGDQFKKLIVNVGCATPAQPVEKMYRFAVWNWVDPLSFVQEGDLEILFPKYRYDPESSFPDPVELSLERLKVEGVEAGETPSPDVPSIGYFIKDTVSGLSFYHTADIWEPYPEMEQLRGKVDYLFHMKTGWGTWSRTERAGVYGWDPQALRELVEYVRPKYLVPIHYRPMDTQDYPIPRNYTFEAKLEERVRNGWVPELDDPSAYVNQIIDTVGDLTRVVPITAGKRYRIRPSDKTIRWEWSLDDGET